MEATTVTTTLTTPVTNDLTLADPGAIFEYSWGYDQTNIDYFQVVRRSGSTVWVRPIGKKSVGGEGFMCDNVMPVKDAFVPEPCSATADDYECGMGPDAYRHNASCGAFEHDYQPKVGGNTRRKRVQFSQGRPYLAKPYGWCGLWDGKASYRSWYA